ncbi:MAG: threonine--tRNA ligase [Candidatus Colwellbacteria bacterium]|nr:threonine--tRNA ligase [Candidatus Colwellbacteria bacterium]
MFGILPKGKLGIGPAIENGFYYDFLLPRNLTPDDLKGFEKRMREIIKQGLAFRGKKVTSTEARKTFKDQPFKLELIKDFAREKKQLSIYKTGDVFTDLCRGGHVKNTKEINPDAFRLTSIAGAYWKGSEKNPQLQRVYGVAFKTKRELEVYLLQQEEAKKRDHRKLGKELDLFTFSDLVGPGLPLYTPRGTIIINELYRELLRISKDYGVQEVKIPHMAKIELYETSGHAEKFKDELFKVKSHYDIEFVLKPVNCPHHTQIYASRPRSYRDLPLRFIESTAQHRDEKPGEIGGLSRTRSFTVDDGHTFCRVDQIKEEAKNTCRIIERFYKALGLWGDHWVSLSVRDPKTPEKYIGIKADWDKAEKMIQEVSKELKLGGKVVKGEAAIYGPKIDFMFKDALGKEIQLATVQIDFAMPKRFGLTYTTAGGKQETPVMLHRAILGSYERFLAILLEHYAGAFPLWLAPVQVAILPISQKFTSYAEKVAKALREKNIRVEISDANETIGKQIREAELQKIPYLLVVGEKEIKSNSVAVRKRGKGDIGVEKLSKFVEEISKEINERKA